MGDGGIVSNCLIRRNATCARRGGILLLALLAGCATQPPLIEPDPAWEPVRSATVLVIPPDSRIARVTLGGMEEERADWSREARAELQDALATRLNWQGVSTVSYPSHGDVIPWRPEDAPLVAMHEVVGVSILASERLPTQRARRPHLDYSLGGAVKRLREDFGADYALFVQCRASYPSEGRVAIGVMAVLAGRSVHMGSVFGFASLVDLADGKVIWFSAPLNGSGARRGFGFGLPPPQLIATADVREPDGAAAVADLLLAGVPL